MKAGNSRAKHRAAEIRKPNEAPPGRNPDEDDDPLASMAEGQREISAKQKAKTAERQKAADEAAGPEYLDLENLEIGGIPLRRPTMAVFTILQQIGNGFVTLSDMSDSPNLLMDVCQCLYVLRREDEDGAPIPIRDVAKLASNREEFNFCVLDWADTFSPEDMMSSAQKISRVLAGSVEAQVTPVPKSGEPKTPGNG